MGDLQCPLDSVPEWFVTPYRSYLNGPICVRGSSRLSDAVGSRRGTKRVRSRLVVGKMTGVSDRFQKPPA